MVYITLVYLFKSSSKGENIMSESKKSIPIRTPEAKENLLINLAVELAEKKLRDGTASSQIIALLLNLATSKTQLELEKLKSDLRVADAKIKMMSDQETSKDLYENAIKAFKSYSGAMEDEKYEDEYY